jgi:tripartite motif-containing protein 71
MTSRRSQVRVRLTTLIAGLIAEGDPDGSLPGSTPHVRSRPRVLRGGRGAAARICAAVATRVKLRCAVHRIERALRPTIVMVAAAIASVGVSQTLPAAAHNVTTQSLEITNHLHLSHPFGVAADAHRHRMYVADSLNNRVLELAGSGAILHVWHGWRGVPFDQPGAVAVGRGGSVYVIDYGKNRIDRFATDGRALQQWGSYGTRLGRFAAPGDLATDAAGNVYVADTLNFRIQKFSPTGRLIDAWTTLTPSEDHLLAPIGIGVGPNGDVYTTAAAAGTDRFGNVIEAPDALDCVQRFSPAGQLLTRWGTKGSLPGQFHEPRAVVVDAAGRVYVADFGNDRIEQFSVDGSFLRSIGPAVQSGLRLHGPAALALDGKVGLYVADWFNSRIDWLSTSGSILGFWR